MTAQAGGYRIERRSVLVVRGREVMTVPMWAVYEGRYQVSTHGTREAAERFVARRVGKGD